VLTFHRLSAPAQLLNHMVEDTTEVPDLVIAIPKAYRDIEVPFSDAHNLALKFRHHKAQIVAALGCG
jgi:hypothetical protein